MAVTRRDPDALFATRRNKPVPFDFVLDELADLEPWTRPMFGCTAVYVDEKIVFVLRDGKKDDDNGVWVATTKDHHASLRRELAPMRSITVFGAGAGETGWQVLPVDAEDFEQSVLRACALVRAGDARIGKVPRPRKPKKPAPSGPKAKARTGGRARRRP
jgi:hypothetical protein